MAFGSPGPDVDSLGWLDNGFRIPWPRRGFVRLIGLVSMHLNNYYVATESFPPPKVPPPKIPIRHPVNYLRLRFRWLQLPTAWVINKESCWRSNPISPGLLFWVFYTLEESSHNRMQKSHLFLCSLVFTSPTFFVFISVSFKMIPNLSFGWVKWLWMLFFGVLRA